MGVFVTLRQHASSQSAINSKRLTIDDPVAKWDCFFLE